MRYYTILAETTAEQIVKKIKALDATISDAAPTEHEKTGAQRMKDRLVTKLKTEHPEVNVDATSEQQLNIIQRKINDLFWKAADFRRQREPENAQAVSDQIDELLKKYMPDEWAKTQARRAKKKI